MSASTAGGLALAAAAGLVRWWVRAYTAGLPPAVRAARRAELESDLWEQQAAARLAGHSSVATGAHLGARWLLGVGADLAWRQANASAHPSARDEARATRTAAALAAPWLAPAANWVAAARPRMRAAALTGVALVAVTGVMWAAVPFEGDRLFEQLGLAQEEAPLGEALARSRDEAPYRGWEPRIHQQSGAGGKAAPSHGEPALPAFPAFPAPPVPPALAEWPSVPVSMTQDVTTQDHGGADMNRRKLRIVASAGAALVAAGSLPFGGVALAQTTLEQARAAALAAVPGGTVLEIETERKGGRVTYEVEIRRPDGQVVEVMVDMATPTVLGTALDDNDGPGGIDDD